MSSIRCSRRRFNLTGAAGSKSVLIAPIIPAIPFSGNAEFPSRFFLYFPCISVMCSSPSSGDSKYNASTPKSSPPSTMPSNVSSSVRSNAVFATRKRNAIERFLWSSAPDPSALLKASECFSTMPDTCWSMICVARDIGNNAESGLGRMAVIVPHRQYAVGKSMKFGPRGSEPYPNMLESDDGHAGQGA